MTFTLLKKQALPDINSQGYLYEHDQTKAQVIFVQNDDDNRAFSISFATPPYDDNGIAHIIEHSVLCGSRKYPSKEPFVELYKGSLNTFLNAMTFSDKTMYPVSSKNKKDFKNLMDVYLDAVFFPKFYENPLILAQEGWHHHLEKAEDELIYKGVVYNEMKGSLSDPERVMFNKAYAELFPTTIYRHEPGGNPLAIPSLTQEKFVDFHQTYYHPSNSQTFLYGDLVIDEELAHLEDYFSQFDYQLIDKGITKEAPFEKPREKHFTYSISDQEDTENKTFLSADFVVGDSANMAQEIQFSILLDILLGSDAAPLKKALLDANISADISGEYFNYSLQSVVDICLRNSRPEHMPTFQKIVKETLENLVKEGLPQDHIEAAINKTKFHLVENVSQGGFPKGILYAMQATSGWLYGADPFTPFFFNDIITSIEADTSIFTKLIQTHLLDNPHTLWLTASPQPNLNEEAFAEAHAALQNKKASLSADQLTQILEETEALIQRQSSPDSPEDLAKLPSLTLEDLDEKAKELPLIHNQVDQVKHLHFDTFTGGIEYISAYFDLGHLSTEELPYLSLLAHLLRQLSTKQYSLDKLITEIDKQTGGISFSISTLNKNTKTADYQTYLIAKGKAFHDKVPHLLDLMQEVLVATDLNQAQRIKDQLLKLKTRLEDRFISQSHQVTAYRLMSYYSPAHLLEESMSGIDFYTFICSLLKDFDTKADQLIQKLETVYAKAFNRQRLQFTTIGQRDLCQADSEKIKVFSQAFSNEPVPDSERNLVPQPLNEAFTLSQDVQFVAQGYNVQLVQGQDLAYTGHLRVLNKVLSAAYLWNRVRVQGGAYGAFNIANRDGNFGFVSYRDPNVARTIEAYEEASDFVANLDLDQRELTKYIIGTFSDLDTPLSPRRTGELAFTHYFLGLSPDDIQKERSQVLHTSLEDLRQLASYVQAAMTPAYRCVLGSKQALEKDENLFKTIQPLVQ